MMRFKFLKGSHWENKVKKVFRAQGNAMVRRKCQEQEAWLGGWDISCLPGEF